MDERHIGLILDGDLVVALTPAPKKDDPAKPAPEIAQDNLTPKDTRGAGPLL